MCCGKSCCVEAIIGVSCKGASRPTRTERRVLCQSSITLGFDWLNLEPSGGRPPRHGAGLVLGHKQ